MLSRTGARVCITVDNWAVSDTRGRLPRWRRLPGFGVPLRVVAPESEGATGALQVRGATAREQVCAVVVPGKEPPTLAEPHDQYQLREKFSTRG